MPVYCISEGLLGKHRTGPAISPRHKQAGNKQKALICTPEIQFVLLDEINIALRYDYLDIDEVVQFLLKEKPPERMWC